MNSYAMRVTPRQVTDVTKPFGVLDLFVILLCLSTAAGGVYFFYISLFQTLTSNLDPIGTVTIRYNSIQRRQGDRVLWDRLQNESPLYPGDLIRVAELSGATLNFDGNQLELNENTLIRVNMRNGRPQIELSSGTVNLDTTNSESNISLVVSGRVIEPTQGTVLRTSAIIGEDGNTTMALQVTEGSAVISEGGGNEQLVMVNEQIIISNEQIEISNFQLAIYDEQLANENEELAIYDEQLAINIEPPLLLDAPVLIQPNNGFTIRPVELQRMNHRIIFRWSPVDEANAYIFALYHQTAANRRQVIRTNPQTSTSYTLTNMGVLGRGTFVWQVEAVNFYDGEITRRGNIQENTFVINIPAPSAVTPQQPGRLYGQ
jgi:hypothetical protein